MIQFLGSFQLQWAVQVPSQFPFHPSFLARTPLAVILVRHISRMETHGDLSRAQRGPVIRRRRAVLTEAAVVEERAILLLLW